MTTVINGSSPSITFSDSTTQTTAFTTTPTINTITSAASTALTIQSAGTTAITVDTSQNVGIGVVPSAWGSVYSKAIQISTQGAYIAGNTSTYSGGTYAWFGNNGYLDSSAVFRYTASTSACQYSQIANQHIWSYAASGTAGNAITFSEAMRIDSSGNLLVGTTSANSSRLSVVSTGTNSGSYVFVGQNSALSNQITVRSDGVGFLNASAWVYSSDATLKENITYLNPTDCLNILSNAKPVKFDYIDGQKQNYGYLAQEVQTWLPESVSENSNEKLGLQDGFINVLSTGAILALKDLIQEQQALIESLTKRLADASIA